MDTEDSQQTDKAEQSHASPAEAKPVNRLNPNEWFKSDNPTPLTKNNGKFKNNLQKLYANKNLLLPLAVVSILFIGSVTYGLVRLNKKPITPDTGLESTTEMQARDSALGSEDSISQTSGEDTLPTDPQTTTNNSSTKPSGSSTSPSGGSAPLPPDQPTSQTHNISYGSNCFTPSTLNIKNGDTVVFKNDTSNRDMWPASDKHPKHENYEEFDAKTDIPPGGKYSFTFTRAGTWGFHDHNLPGCSGTITVI